VLGVSELNEGITLRAIHYADLPSLTGGDSPFDDFGPRPQRIAPPGSDLTETGGLAVVDPSGVLLGSVSWHWVRWGPNPESSNPMIGIWLRAGARGRGVGTTAQRALTGLFFERTTVHRIEAHTDVDNVAEQRALEKSGFTREGTTRAAQWRQGAFHDGYLFSILRSEWPPGAQAE
jgi:RimJ/RimL family protein N-acetyltransferase